MAGLLSIAKGVGGTSQVKPNQTKSNQKYFSALRGHTLLSIFDHC
jgi:hypothetical protein